MNVQRWISLLTMAGTVAGAAVIFTGIALFFAAGSVPSLLISLSVIIVGPVEDLLSRWVERRTEPGTARVEGILVVDRTTSLVFLLLLLTAMLLPSSP